jgi:cyclase
MKVRIIPTILTDGLTVVKGENFVNDRTVGSAEATARLYSKRDVDELIFLDVKARLQNRMVNLDLISKFAELLDTPFGVGGGINSIEDARHCIRRGAEKVVLGTAALQNPKLISEIAAVFGSQAVVVSVDIADDFGKTLGSKSATEIVDMDALEFALKAQELGAGEILLQSVKHDGLMQGVNIGAIKTISEKIKIPLIASSGVGKPEDLLNAFSNGAAAVAIGALFQFTQTTPKTLRDYLKDHGINVREVVS